MDDDEADEEADGEGEEGEEQEGEEEEEGEQEEGAPETDEDMEEVKQTRDVILKGIDILQAYMPHPASDPVFFQRMLMKIKAMDDETALWFPWGAPPLQALGLCLNSDKDPYLAKYAKDILDRFMAAFNTTTLPEQLAFMNK